MGIHLFPYINIETIKSIFQNNSYQISGKSELSDKAEDQLREIERSESLKKCGELLNLLDLFLNDYMKQSDYGNNPFLHRIIQWSESNYHKKITLDQGAAAVHLSRYHFARKFKEQTGSTYMEYLNILRLENSLKCLQEGCSITDTSEKSGFSDVSYYIKKFRQTYGKTPLEYQKS